MKSLEQEILNRIDKDGIAIKIGAAIASDEAFFESVKTELRSRLFDDYRQRAYCLESQIIKQLADQFVREHAQEILAKVDVSAVLNAIALHSAKNVAGGL